MNSTRYRLSVLAASAVLAGAALPAFSGHPSESFDGTTRAVQVPVDYSDLNLTTPGGVETLYERISRAARQACGSTGRTLVELKAHKTCYDRAVSDAVEKVGSTTLTALHRSRVTRPAT